MAHPQLAIFSQVLAIKFQEFVRYQGEGKKKKRGEWSPNRSKSKWERIPYDIVWKTTFKPKIGFTITGPF
jgi:hypothetical protein